MAKQLSTLQPRSVLGSSGVVLMSCKVKSHAVRSALPNSMRLLNNVQLDLKQLKSLFPIAKHKK